MSITPDDATDWRELAEQLAPKEVATIGSLERSNLTPQNLLVRARSYVRDRLTISMIGDVPLPAGVSSISEWQEPDFPSAYRYFDIA